MSKQPTQPPVEESSLFSKEQLEQMEYYKRQDYQWLSGKTKHLAGLSEAQNNAVKDLIKSEMNQYLDNMQTFISQGQWGQTDTIEEVIK